MTSMTFKMSKLKFSTRSSAKHGLRDGSEDMAVLKSTLESSLIHRFLTVFDFVCMSGKKDMLRKHKSGQTRKDQSQRDQKHCGPL